jgi:hypothetical protein
MCWNVSLLICQFFLQVTKKRKKKGMEQDKFNDKYYPTVPKVKKKYNSPINHISEKDFVIIKYQ